MNRSIGTYGEMDSREFTIDSHEFTNCFLYNTDNHEFTNNHEHNVRIGIYILLKYSI
jgi:hypothetical protein